MLRPLPPFRVRPLNRVKPPKFSMLSMAPDLFGLTSVRADRRPVKVARAMVAPAGLKVLGRKPTELLSRLS